MDQHDRSVIADRYSRPLRQGRCGIDPEDLPHQPDGRSLSIQVVEVHRSRCPLLFEHPFFYPVQGMDRMKHERAPNKILEGIACYAREPSK